MDQTVGLPFRRLELEPERIEQGLARLVLAVVELIREVLERQAVRRVEAGGLSDEEVERLGLALLRLDERLATVREAFGLTQDDVTLRLNPATAEGPRGTDDVTGVDAMSGGGHA
jgi:hypothetical protein